MLSEKRKSDRTKMADILEKIAIDKGAKVSRFNGDHPDNWHGPHCIILEIEGPRGLSVTIDLDGKSPQPNIFVMPWHLRGYPVTERLSKKLEMAALGSVNEYHFHKCMGVVYGFEKLQRSVEEVLEMANSGTAFQSA